MNVIDEKFTADGHFYTVNTFVEWYNIPRLIYCLSFYIYKRADYSLTFTWVDMDSNIGESSLFVLRRNNG